MLLVIGRPGAGCSTFLKTIAGDIGEYDGIEGNVLYDGVPQEEMLRNFKNDIIYNGECKLNLVFCCFMSHKLTKIFFFECS
jgi:ATP-binding cassette subfamily G (WHITE) protein 2 (SNQ2)